MLNTESIYEMIWRDPPTSDYVLAVAPPSALKFIQSDHKERCYIVNCYDDDDKMYSRVHAGHWFVIVVHPDEESGKIRERGGMQTKKKKKNSRVEVFDSLGSGKEYNKDIIDFISKFECCTVYSKLLDISNCGYYALVYAHYRARKYGPSETVAIIEQIANVKEYCLSLFGVLNE